MLKRRQRLQLITLADGNRNDLAVKRAKKALKTVERVTKKTATLLEIQEAARKAGKYAISALEDIVRSRISTDVARISAAQTLLDRGYGRPTQTSVNATVNTDGKPTEVTQQELDRRIKETITRIEGLTKRKREKIEGEEPPADLRKYN